MSAVTRWVSAWVVVSRCACVLSATEWLSEGWQWKTSRNRHRQQLSSGSAERSNWGLYFRPNKKLWFFLSRSTKSNSTCARFVVSVIDSVCCALVVFAIPITHISRVGVLIICNCPCWGICPPPPVRFLVFSLAKLNTSCTWFLVTFCSHFCYFDVNSLHC